MGWSGETTGHYPTSSGNVCVAIQNYCRHPARGIHMKKKQQSCCRPKEKPDPLWLCPVVNTKHINQRARRLRCTSWHYSRREIYSGPRVDTIAASDKTRPFFSMPLHNCYSTNASVHWSRRQQKTIAGGNEIGTLTGSVGWNLCSGETKMIRLYSGVLYIINQTQAHITVRMMMMIKKNNLLHACPTAGLNTRLDTKTCFVIRLGGIFNLTCWWQNRCLRVSWGNVIHLYVGSHASDVLSV